VLGAGVGLLVGLGVAVALSWHFSSRVLVPDHSSWSEEVRIEAVASDRIVLARSETALWPGFYGLLWQGGHAVVGPISAIGPETVTRQLRDVRGYLAPGAEAGFDSHVYAGNPRQARGLPFRSVHVRSELGQMPAWLVPGRASTWVIVVHGHNDDPQVGLRIAPALHRMGLPTLSITYRNDLGAPPSPDGLHHLGLTEWRDLEAAADYAFDHGATRLVLIGYSMGGAVIGQFMRRSALAGDAAALILDAPALDWSETLAFNVEQIGLPSFASLPLKSAIGARIDADWEALDMTSHPEDLHLPILLFHGTDDELVPIETSDELAEELPGQVTYHRVPAAGHTHSWNVDPRLYERRVRAFLAKALKTDRARPLGSGSKR